MSFLTDDTVSYSLVLPSTYAGFGMSSVMAPTFILGNLIFPDAWDDIINNNTIANSILVPNIAASVLSYI